MHVTPHVDCMLEDVESLFDFQGRNVDQNTNY
jgi:hypothetical protein